MAIKIARPVLVTNGELRISHSSSCGSLCRTLLYFHNPNMSLRSLRPPSFEKFLYVVHVRVCLMHLLGRGCSVTCSGFRVHGLAGAEDHGDLEFCQSCGLP